MERDSAERRVYSVRAVQRVCDIMDLLRSSDADVSLTRIAEVTELPKSSALRYLSTLESRRYAQRDAMTGNYRLGPALIPRPSQRLEAMRQHARPHIERLRDEFNETVNFGVLDGTHVYYVEIIESRRNVRLASSPAVRGPIHSTGLGKAIASQLPTDRVQWILSMVGMHRYTVNTIATPEEYILELDRIRDRGYAIDDRESTDEGRCVAVPFPGETLPAALSISAPAYRFPMDQVEVVAVALKKAVLVIKGEIEGMSSSR